MKLELTNFYSRLGTIALILVLGFYLGKKKIINHEINNGLVNLLLSVLMPASLFLAFPTEYDETKSQMFF